MKSIAKNQQKTWRIVHRQKKKLPSTALNITFIVWGVRQVPSLDVFQ